MASGFELQDRLTIVGATSSAVAASAASNAAATGGAAERPPPPPPSVPLRPMRKLPHYGLKAVHVLPPPAPPACRIVDVQPGRPSCSTAPVGGSGAGGRLLALPGHARRWYDSRAAAAAGVPAAEVDGAPASSVFSRLLGKPSKPEPWFIRWAPKLSWEDRVLGFLGCLVVAWALTASSIFSYHMLLMGAPGPFATRYTLGNVLAVASSSFLMGPQQQIRQMLDPSRIVATSLYLGSILATLTAALLIRSAELVLACICLQFCAMLYYGLSYIPYGKQLVGRACRWLLSRS